MSLIDWFAARRKDQFVGKVSQDTDEGDGLWVKCSECSQVAYRKDLISNFNVCSNCGHHNRINSDERINIIADKNSFKEFDSSLSPTDPLGFKDRRAYADRIKESQAGTGLRDGVVTGICSVNSMPLALAVMDFRFMGGSMGSVVGEKVSRMIDYAHENKLPMLLVCASGGARMQEGALSLLQLAKTSAKLAQFSDGGGLYIPILTDPTTGGVTASYGMLGDLILAEPGALIGFAGPRVIKQTIGQDLPEGFQRTEFLKEKGFVDHIVTREKMKSTLYKIISILHE